MSEKWLREHPEYKKEYYQKNKEKIIAKVSEWQRNNSDRVNKKNRIWREKNREKYLEQQRLRMQRWRQENSEKNKEIQKIYRENNREKCREECRKWRTMNPEKAREATRIWRANNPDKIEEYVKIHAPIYYQENRDKILIRMMPYRMILNDNSVCSICLSKEKIVVHHKDRNHKNNNPENLQILCSSCHSKLHNPIGIKFATRGGV